MAQSENAVAQNRMMQVVPGMWGAAAAGGGGGGPVRGGICASRWRLAILLSFLLAPIVSRVQKWHVPRVPAALLVMAVILVLIGSVGWLVIGQTIQLADKLPQYQATVHEKLETFHARPGSTFDRLNRTFEDFASEVDSITSQPATPPSQPATIASSATTTSQEAPKAIEVTLAKTHASGLEILRNLMIRAIGPIATLGIVLILTLFMLIQREDLRDRRLAADGKGAIESFDEGDRRCRQ